MATDFTVMTDFRLGNGGSVLHVQFLEDGLPYSVKDATTVSLLFRHISENTATIKSAILETDGSDGKVKYVFTAADLAKEGEWKVQGFARFSPTAQIYSSIAFYTVGPNLGIVPA